MQHLAKKGLLNKLSQLKTGQIILYDQGRDRRRALHGVG